MEFLKVYPQEKLYQYNLGNNSFLIKYSDGDGQRICSAGALKVDTNILSQNLMVNKNLRYIKSEDTNEKKYQLFQFQNGIDQDLVILSYSNFGDPDSKVVLSFQAYSNLTPEMKELISD